MMVGGGGTDKRIIQNKKRFILACSLRPGQWGVLAHFPGAGTVRRFSRRRTSRPQSTSEQSFRFKIFVTLSRFFIIFSSSGQ